MKKKETKVTVRLSIDLCNKLNLIRDKYWNERQYQKKRQRKQRKSE